MGTKSNLHDAAAEYRRATRASDRAEVEYQHLVELAAQASARVKETYDASRQAHRALLAVVSGMEVDD